MSAGAQPLEAAAAGLPDARGLRVLVIAACPFPDLRGTAARAKLLAELAARCGAQVEIVAPAEGRELPLSLPVHRAARASLRARLSAGPSPGRLLLRDPLLAAAARRAGRALRPHVVHAHHVEGVLVARAAGLGGRAGLVYDAHTSVAAELPSWVGVPRASAWLGGRIERRAARAADHVVTVSDTLRSELEALADLAPGTLSTLPTPLDPLPALAARPAADGAAPRVVYAGGLSRFQRLDRLRDAFERHVWPARSEVELELLACDGPEALAWPGALREPRLRVRPSEGVASDLARLAAADLSVVPRSARGGLPQKIVNAMRLGVPLVACEGAWDGLDARFARVVAPDARALGEAILSLLASPVERARLAAAARAEAERRFGAASVARRLLAAYRAASRRTSALSLKSSSGSSASSSTSSTISSV